MTNLQNFWADQEIDELGIALSLAYKGQKNYKEPLELKDRVRLWRFVLEEKYSVAQVLFALRKFLERNEDMPVPASIVEILDPPKPRITDTQYIAAKEWQKAQGYPAFSDSLDVIKAYESQGAEDIKKFEIEDQKIKSLVASSIKKIS